MPLLAVTIFPAAFIHLPLEDVTAVAVAVAVAVAIAVGSRSGRGVVVDWDCSILRCHVCYVARRIWFRLVCFGRGEGPRLPDHPRCN